MERRVDDDQAVREASQGAREGHERCEKRCFERIHAVMLP
jgi:hypothetical protein